MKFDLKDFKKVEENEKGIVLEHKKGHKMQMAKSGLSPDLKAHLASMPVHNYAEGGEVKTEVAPQEEGVLDKISNMFSSEGQATTPNQLSKEDLYNQFVTGTTGPDSSIAQHNMQGSGSLFENGQPPVNFNPKIAEQASNAYEQEKAAVQARQQSQEKEQYQNVLQENQARAQFGMAPVSVPNAPEAVPAGMAAPTAQGSQVQNMQGLNPLGQQMPVANPQEYQKAYNEQLGGIYGQAEEQGKLGAEKQASAAEQAQKTQNLMNHYQEQSDALSKEIQNTMEDIKNTKINPNHYFENMSTEGRVSTAIGMLLGGIGSSSLGGKNPAMDYINEQVGRDIDAQAKNLGVKESLLSANFKQFGNIRDATEMTRLMMNGIYANKIEEAGAKATGPLAKQIAAQEAGKLKQDVAMKLPQLAFRQALMKGAQNGDIDPAQAVPFMVPSDRQKDVFEEIKHAQNTTKIAPQIMDAFDKSAKATHAADFVPGVPSADQKHLEALLNTTVTETEGTARQAAFDSIHKNMIPNGLDNAYTKQVKREAMEQYLKSKQAAPTAKGYGINLANYGSTNERVLPAQQNSKVQTFMRNNPQIKTQDEAMRILRQNGKM